MAARAQKKSPSVDDLLDDLLPRPAPEQVELHRNAALLEVDDPVRLLELAQDPGVRALLLCRLAPTVALVDPGGAERLVEVLRKRGHTPRVVGA